MSKMEPTDATSGEFTRVPLSLQRRTSYTTSTGVCCDRSTPSPAISDSLGKRLARLVRVFDASYPTPSLPRDTTSDASAAVQVAVAPGRVNLIGEHIDYEGYSVLPMAIDQSIAIAFRVPSISTHGGIAISAGNTDPRFAFTSITTTAASDMRTEGASSLFQKLTASLRTPESQWTKYLVCGYMAVIQWRPALAMQSLSVDLEVESSIPPACGLSSSSALVVASALAFASVLCSSSRVELPTRTQLAENCRLAEQHIGTVGGGMDQAVSCLAQPHAALLVSFEPRLHVENVPFATEIQPNNAVFMVVNSGIQAHKAVDATARFNKRVVECALATKLLGKRLGSKVSGWQTLTTLRELQTQLQKSCSGGGDGDSGHQELPFAELLGKTVGASNQELNEQEFTLEKLTQELLDGKALLHTLFQGSRLETVAKQVLTSESRFRLWQRVRHVWSEAARVTEFRTLLTAESSTNARLPRLGSLMLESHASCRDLYECSCPELDAIVNIATNAGAFGGRLTGAGWGGCAVLLVPTDRVEIVKRRLKDHFFNGSMPDDAVFIAHASQGAQLFTVESYGASF